MKKAIITAVTAAVITVIGSFTALADGGRVLKFGHVNGDTHPINLAAQKMAEIIAEKTEGRYTMDVYANSALGGERDLIEGVQMGAVDLCYTAATPLGNYVPELMVTDLPFLIEDQDHANAVYYGEIGDELKGFIDNSGLKALTFVDIGFRNVGLVSKPVTSAADLEGIKIRTMENELHLEAWRALGADPVPMSFGDAFTAFQQGAIDALEMTNTHLVANGVSDVMKYYAETRHVYTPGLILISPFLWDSLSEEDQQIFMEAALEARDLNNELNTQMEEENAGVIADKGVEMHTLDAAELQEKVQSVYDNHPEFTEMVEKIRNAK